jgi:hypothetical protein
MRIQGPANVSQAAAARTPKGVDAGGFSVAGAGSGSPAARTASAAGVGSLEALIALQGAADPLERRRRAVGRAGKILDMLDEVKISLLGGGAATGAIGRLMQAVSEQRDATEDVGLEGVLNEIETRAAVELAKAEMSRAAA